VLEQKEELARIVEAIQALPERQRRALTLRELEGRSYGEISAELGHTDSGVRQLIFRARTALRNLGAFILPLGSIRWRLLGVPSSSAGADPHHIAAAATVSSGGGPNVLQAAASVVVGTLALLGAGQSQGAHHRDRAAAAGMRAAPFDRHSAASTGASGAAGGRAPDPRHRAGAVAGGDGGAEAFLPAPVPVTDMTAPSEPTTVAGFDGNQPTDRAAPEESGGEEPQNLEALDSSTDGAASQPPASDPGDKTSGPAPAPSGDGTTAPASTSPAGTQPADAQTPTKKPKPPKAPSPPKVNPAKQAVPKKPVPPRPPAAPKLAFFATAS
jgi:hypothetical protein